MKFLLKSAGSILLVLIALCAWAMYWHPLWVADEQIRYHLWRSNVKSDSVMVDGYRIHFFEAQPAGGGPGKPLLLIHGLGSHGEDWSPMIPKLAAGGFHVYAPDLLGYGRSARPDVSYSITQEESIMNGFLDAVHLDKASVAGVSMGGWIAMKLTLDHPQRVDRLVLLDSAGTHPVRQLSPDLFTPHDGAGLQRLVAMLFPHPQPMPGFVARDALRKLQRNAWIVNRSMDQMKTGQDFVDARLGEIRQPTLILWGSEDELIPLAAGQQIHASISGSVLDVLEGCGHVPGPEGWQRVTASTLDFLQAQPPPSGGEHVLPAR